MCPQARSSEPMWLIQHTGIARDAKPGMAAPCEGACKVLMELQGSPGTWFEGASMHVHVNQMQWDYRPMKELGDGGGWQMLARMVHYWTCRSRHARYNCRAVCAKPRWHNIGMPQSARLAGLPHEWALSSEQLDHKARGLLVSCLLAWKSPHMMSRSIFVCRCSCSCLIVA